MSGYGFDYETIRNAVAEVTGGSMVTGYALVAQVVDAEGTTTIQTITDCDHAWQVLGMLHHALLVTQTSKYDGEGTV